MKRTSMVVFAAASLLGLGAGSVFGSIMAREFDAGMHFMRASGAQGQLSNFAAREFMSADDVHAREAVLLEIDILTKLEHADHNAIRQFDLEIGYARLAVIENKLGHNEEEADALAQARYWIELGHPHRELTDKEIEDTVARWDRMLYKAQSE